MIKVKMLLWLIHTKNIFHFQRKAFSIPCRSYSLVSLCYALRTFQSNVNCTYTFTHTHTNTHAPTNLLFVGMLLTLCKRFSIPTSRALPYTHVHNGACTAQFSRVHRLSSSRFSVRPVSRLRSFHPCKRACTFSFRSRVPVSVCVCVPSVCFYNRAPHYIYSANENEC